MEMVRPLGVVGTAATFSVVVAAVIAIVIFARNDPVVLATGPTPSASSKSDTEQITEVVAKFQDVWNDSNFAGFMPIICEDGKSPEVFNESDFLDARRVSDDLELEVATVDVMGDGATAIVTNKNKDPDDIAFVREGGEWKWCDFF
jgi:hypothetical protein